MTALSEEAIILLHLISLNGDHLPPGVLADRPAWRTSVTYGELRQAGCLDEQGWMTALGREILGERQP